MCECFADLKGWARHQHFGLRSEWIRLIHDHPETWHGLGLLGPDQIRSLLEWLTTTGLVDKCGRETLLARHLRSNGVHDEQFWSLVWVNVVFSLVTARWYASLPYPSARSTTELSSLLRATVPRLSNRTARNAIYGLVGTLERTPIGTELGQGIVSATRPRTVRRVGLARPDVVSLAHAMRRLFQHEGREELHLVEPLTWPWVVFGCDAEEALLRLSSETKDWLEIRSDRVRLRIPREELDELALF